MTATEQTTTRREVKDKTTRGQQPLPPAKTPIGPGAITFVGAFLSLLVILAGAVGLQAAASAAGISRSAPWLTSAIDNVDGLRPTGWMLPTGIVLVLLGLWLLVTALRPRPKTAVALTAQTGVYIRPRDMATLAEHAADDLDGVASVRARASRRKVTMSVQSTGGPGVADAVKAAVTDQLQPVQRTPRVAVKVKKVHP